MRWKGASLAMPEQQSNEWWVVVVVVVVLKQAVHLTADVLEYLILLQQYYESLVY